MWSEEAHVDVAVGEVRAQGNGPERGDLRREMNAGEKSSVWGVGTCVYMYVRRVEGGGKVESWI